MNAPSVLNVFARPVAAALIAVSITLLPPGTMPARAQGPASVADLAEKLLGTVVNISTTQKVTDNRSRSQVPRAPEGSPFQEFFDELFPERRGEGGENERGPRSAQSQGSGFVIDASGLIVTNNHVIADADEIIANFTDGRKLKAELIGRDAKTDIAVLRVNSQTPLNAVGFGDSDKARVGDWVMAIGNPFGFGRSVTIGIVSAIGRDINSGPYDNYIQTDAAINKGNSGGPLFNMDGEVIGINTAIISPSGGSIGLGFSIPANLARGVVKGGPAETAGIKAGDVVLSFNGRDIPEMRDLPKIVADTAVGSEVDVVVLRKSEQQTLRVTVGRLEDGEKQLASVDTKEAPQAEDAKPMLGLTLKALDDLARAEQEIAAEIKGVLVTEVLAGSQAEEKGIKPGEVIVEIGQEAVSTPQEASDRIDLLKKEGRKSALVMVSSKTGDIRFVVLRIEG